MRKQGHSNNNKEAHFPCEEKLFVFLKLYDRCKQLYVLRNDRYILTCKYSIFVRTFSKLERLSHEQRRWLWGSSQSLSNYTDFQELWK